MTRNVLYVLYVSVYVLRFLAPINPLLFSVSVAFSEDFIVIPAPHSKLDAERPALSCGTRPVSSLPLPSS